MRDLEGRVVIVLFLDFFISYTLSVLACRYMFYRGVTVQIVSGLI